MLVNGELIVGMWFLPVGVFILIPLLIFGVWLLIQAGKQTRYSAGELDKVVRDGGDTTSVKTAQPSATD